MDYPYLLQSSWQLILSAVFSSLVGFEREMHGHQAGLRTHILVGVGSTLFTLASLGIAEGHAVEQRSRIAAQIVSGIGFLGAGTIMRQGSAVRGLTTAASLWAVAGVGLAIGVGGRLLLAATAATVVIVATLTLVRELEGWLEGRRIERELRVTVSNPRGMMQSIAGVLESRGLVILRVNLTSDAGGTASAFVLKVRGTLGVDLSGLTDDLVEMPEVLTAEWD